MRIQVSCPSCGKEGSVRESFAGRKLKCKACGGIITVPFGANETGISPSPLVPDRLNVVSSTAADLKLSPALANTDGGYRVHPAVWVLVGGAVVAVVAIAITLVIQAGGKSKVANSVAPDDSALRLELEELKRRAESAERKMEEMQGASRTDIDRKIADAQRKLEEAQRKSDELDKNFKRKLVCLYDAKL